MRRIAAIAAILLLLTTTAPLLACASGNASMSHAESACCRSMHGNCGPEMATQKCCQSDLHHNLPQLASNPPFQNPLSLQATPWSPLSAPVPSASVALAQLPSGPSPPRTSTANTLPLRI